jgi:hypothetical protein
VPLQVAPLAFGGTLHGMHDAPILVGWFSDREDECREQR